MKQRECRHRRFTTTSGHEFQFQNKSLLESGNLDCQQRKLSMHTFERKDIICVRRNGFDAFVLYFCGIQRRHWTLF